MLFRREDLERVRTGELTAAYRRWRRPTVRTGGSLLTPVGRLAIDEVRDVEGLPLDPTDLAAAGFDSAEELMEQPALRRDGRLHLVRFHLAGDDPRVALREQDELSDTELAELLVRLDRMDRRAAHGPWTHSTLALIGDRDGVRAADLATDLGRERAAFKADVRKLKALGLTESLEVGYRLSPRGRRVLDELSRSGSAPG